MYVSFYWSDRSGQCRIGFARPQQRRHCIPVDRERQIRGVQGEREVLQQQKEYEGQIHELKQQLHKRQFRKFCAPLVSPERCYATGKGLEVAIVGENSTAIVHAVDEEGRGYDTPLENINCELMSKVDNTTFKCKVEKKNSQYEISYQPTHKGKHQLNIRIEGVHIRGSPFTVVVKTPAHSRLRNLLEIRSVCPIVMLFSIVLAIFTLLEVPVRTPIRIPIKIIEQSVEVSNQSEVGVWGVLEPLGIAVRDNGEIVVVERGKHCVSIFAPNGTKIRTFGTKGSGQGQFDYPDGVALDSAGNILVVDHWKHRIQKFTAEGKFLKAFGRQGRGRLEFYFPTGIGINHKNKNVYVCDCHNHRLQILNENLTFSGIFGGSGKGDGQFKLPRDVTFDSTGILFITDSGNHRIQVFTPEGMFLRRFGTKGRGEGELKWPSSVSIDSNDLLHVAERDNHRVSIFTCQGNFIRSFGTKGTRPGEFNQPHGIAVDTSGLVYVSDTNNNRMQIF